MGCIAAKALKRDIRLELSLPKHLFEVESSLKGHVVYTIYNCQKVLKTPSLRLIGVEKVLQPQQKAFRFLDEQIELRGLPMSWDVGIYTLDFTHHLPKKLASSFKHKMAQVSYTVELRCDSVCVSKEIMLVKPRATDHFYSSIHGKRQFEKKGKRGGASIASVETRLERNTFTKSDTIKGFASLDCSQCSSDLKLLKIELVQEIIYPSKIKQLSLKETKPYRPESQTVLQSLEFKGLEAFAQRPQLFVYEFDLPQILKLNHCLLFHNEEDQSKGVLMQTSRRQTLFICQYSIRITPIFGPKSSQFISIPLYLYNDGETKPLEGFTESSIAATDQELQEEEEEQMKPALSLKESLDMCSEEYSPISPTKLGLLRGENSYLAFKFMSDEFGNLNTERGTESNRNENQF